MNLPDKRHIIRNTKKEGIISFLFFKDKKKYIGICLSFNIIEEGTNFETIKKHLITSAKLHLETVYEKNLSDDLLNRHADKKYWEIYWKAKELSRPNQIPKDFGQLTDNSYKKGEFTAYATS